MTELNCPVCGASVPAELKFAKLTVCEHCKTSLFLEDDAVKNIGTKSALADAPSVFEIGHRYQYRNWIIEIFGRARFDYGDGYWDEWWVLLDSGAGRWVSVDEGDIAVESTVELDERLPSFENARIGQEVRLDGMGLCVTEKNSARCLGVEGQLPEIIMPGDTHDYLHLSGPKGALYTVEYQNGSIDIHRGSWIDPFDIQPL
ncbi:MAG: DUF4178 domain-containing protein [Gammaproteobacteria bacterium]|nr:DUF4178 domain-containing protein [Gammaproteobacteria bacterium]